MPLPKEQIELAKSQNSPTGQVVRFFCFGSGTYELEKHTHDHEEYMRKCDSDLIRLLAQIFHGIVSPYVDREEISSANGREALAILKMCVHGLSEYGYEKHDILRQLKPRSSQMIFHCAGYLSLALKELNPSRIARLPHTVQGIPVSQLYNQLICLAKKAERRYEEVSYSDIVHT